MTKKNLRKCNRQGNQRCEICKEKIPLVEHHINGRNIPKWNQPWNVVWICPNCHDKIHMIPPKIKVEGWFQSSGGKILVFEYV